MAAAFENVTVEVQGVAEGVGVGGAPAGSATSHIPRAGIGLGPNSTQFGTACGAFVSLDSPTALVNKNADTEMKVTKIVILIRGIDGTLSYSDF